MTNPPASPDFDALLKHGRWVRALAHSLLADSAAAEDVEQKTWLAALEHPPRSGANPRAWLGTVVRNFAGTHWREEKARRKRERAVGLSRWIEQSTSTPFLPPDSLANRMETIHSLVRALSNLAEPHATTLYLRFFEELTVREIAKKMNVPRSTTQARIQRGLEMLRSDLASSLGKNWHQCCLVFTVPLTKVASGGLITVFTMTLKTKVLVSLAALTIITLSTWRPWTDSNIRHDQLGEAVVVLDAPREGTGMTTNEAATTIERSPFESEVSTNMAKASVETAPPFVIIVRDANTLEPAVNAEVFVLDHMVESRMEALKLEKERLDLEQKLERFGEVYATDEAGEVHIPFPTGRIEIAARAGLQFAYFQQFANQKGDSDFAELLLRPAISQRVVVVDEGGHPVAGVLVGLSLRNTAPHMFNAEVLETNNQGTVEFRHLEVSLARIIHEAIPIEHH